MTPLGPLAGRKRRFGLKMRFGGRRLPVASQLASNFPLSRRSSPYLLMERMSN
jgi:hypothetical protein